MKNVYYVDIFISIGFKQRFYQRNETYTIFEKNNNLLKFLMDYGECETK